MNRFFVVGSANVCCVFSCPWRRAVIDKIDLSLSYRRKHNIDRSNHTTVVNGLRGVRLVRWLCRLTCPIPISCRTVLCISMPSVDSYFTTRFAACLTLPLLMWLVNVRRAARACSKLSHTSNIYFKSPHDCVEHGTCLQIFFLSRLLLFAERIVFDVARWFTRLLYTTQFVLTFDVCVRVLGTLLHDAKGNEVLQMPD